MDRINVGIIGCGNIGNRRAENLKSAKLIACADVVIDQALTLSNKYEGVSYTDNWKELIEREDVDIVIIATPHKYLTNIAIAALEKGKHVLVEKPAGINSNEVKKVIEAAKKTEKKVRVGFNHRYHPAIRKAYKLFKNDQLSEIMFIRARYGQGGHLGYENEWRANPSLSGGGEIIDQGIHLIDLSRLFLGELSEIQGFAHTYFWKMEVEDNGFMLLKNSRKQVAFLHVSCTEWKNLFSMEIYTKNEKLQIDGLGRSYGVERLTLYKMLPEMGPPDTTIWEYPMVDKSWEFEFKEFIDDIKLNREPSANLSDAYAALKIVEEIYSQSGYQYFNE